MEPPKRSMNTTGPHGQAILPFDAYDASRGFGTQEHGEC